MTTRYYEETPCEHGELTRHPLPGTEKPHDDGSPGWVRDMCLGGSRRELEGVEIVKAVSQWDGVGYQCNLPVSEPGRYAIIPLPEEKE